MLTMSEASWSGIMGMGEEVIIFLIWAAFTSLLNRFEQRTSMVRSQSSVDMVDKQNRTLKQVVFLFTQKSNGSV